MAVSEKTYYSIRRLHAVFAASSLALLAATVWVLVADGRRPWKQYQRTFHEQIERGSATGAGWRPQIAEIDLPELTIDYHFRQVGRVDRCVTCHQGIDRAAYPDAAQPFRSHPRLELFVGEKSPHPAARFGCTVCHEGQGSATDFTWAAHAPNDIAQQVRWRQQYGWSRSPQGDFPMLPGRFA
jgi:hypothetical protein